MKIIRHIDDWSVYQKGVYYSFIITLFLEKEKDYNKHLKRSNTFLDYGIDLKSNITFQEVSLNKNWANKCAVKIIKDKLTEIDAWENLQHKALKESVNFLEEISDDFYWLGEDMYLNENDLRIKRKERAKIEKEIEEIWAIMETPCHTNCPTTNETN